MRILSFVAVTIFCGMGLTFYGTGVMNTNTLAQQQTATEVSSDTKANIQKTHFSKCR